MPLEHIARDAAADDFRRRVALTFDDGLRSNVEVAYPILRRHRLPATFFACPQLIDERRWLWSHEARARLRFLGLPEERVERMKRLPPDERSDEERKLRKASRGWRPSEEERHACDLATWDALRSLDPGLVTIGAHTLTHAILPGLDDAALEREVAGSRRRLEEALGRPAGQFAYPNGDYDARVLECVRRHFDIAVTTDVGVVPAACDALRLPRIAAPRSLLRLALALHRENARTRAPGHATSNAALTSA